MAPEHTVITINSRFAMMDLTSYFLWTSAQHGYQHASNDKHSRHQYNAMDLAKPHILHSPAHIHMLAGPMPLKGGLPLCTAQHSQTVLPQNILQTANQTVLATFPNYPVQNSWTHNCNCWLADSEADMLLSKLSSCPWNSG